MLATDLDAFHHVRWEQRFWAHVTWNLTFAKAPLKSSTKVVFRRGGLYHPTPVCVLLLQDLLQSRARGGRRRVEDMCYERRRAEACVDGVDGALAW